MLYIDISEDKLYKEKPSLLLMLLKDRTIRKSIVWGTQSYGWLGKGFDASDRITPTKVTGMYSDLIKPRSAKSKFDQKNRTKISAEVFTPTWLVKQQSSYVENQLSQLSLKDYVNLTWLEIACGEAPYMVSRYDTVTGEMMPLNERVGFIDRKLQRISQEVKEETKFFEYCVLAYQASYGYEYQGDSLLLARENLLETFNDYYYQQFGKNPTLKQQEEIAKIISYNVFQMNGLTKMIPYSGESVELLTLDLFAEANDDANDNREIIMQGAFIKDWKQNKMVAFSDLENEESSMKFDVVIGNPPYQEELQGTSDKPIYNEFIDASIKIAEKSLLITPARFLFNAGKTPKTWNQKMLNDEHFTVKYYQQDSSKVFPGTDIKGGVAITYHDKNKKFGAIETFTAFDELNKIYRKVYLRNDFETLSDLVFSPESYKLTVKLHEDFPNAASKLSKGHQNDVTTNIFEKLPEIFVDEPNGVDVVQMVGRKDKERVTKFVLREYIRGPVNFEKYKVILPKSNGSGAIGETLSTPLVGTPLVGTPLVGHTQTFLSIGSFETLKEADALFKYIKTKFARTLLGVLKVTQDNKKATWKYVPIQDFTSDSDIDWSKSVAEIDQQLYQKYNLSPEEISFIETHVKEME